VYWRYSNNYVSWSESGLTDGVEVVEVKEGQSFQDGTRLTVRVSKSDNDRVQFSVIEDRDVAGLGEMSYLVFVKRFT
jgi:hypothetical protein